MTKEQKSELAFVLTICVVVSVFATIAINRNFFDTKPAISAAPPVTTTE
jgi:hypothetical protein